MFAGGKLLKLLLENGGNQVFAFLTVQHSAVLTKPHFSASFLEAMFWEWQTQTGLFRWWKQYCIIWFVTM